MKEEIVNSIENLLKNYRDLYTKEEYIFLKKVSLSCQRENFDYEKIREITFQIRPFFTRVWQQELTDFNNYNVGDKFKFVITCPTKDAKDYDIKRKSILSCSLITDKHMGTFNHLNYGLVCDVNENNLIATSSYDVHSVLIKNNNAPAYYYISSLKNGYKIFSEKYVNPLKLPNQIEMDLIKENIKVNGDFIKERFKNVYSDITLDATETNFLGVVLFEPYTERDYNEAYELSQKYSLNVKIIPKDLYYKKISISKENEEAHYYDITALETLIFIIEHSDDISKEYSNLIIENGFSLINIKEESGIGKLSINRELALVNIYLKDDLHYYKIDYSNGFKYLQFFIDNVLVSKEEFRDSLAKNAISMKH